MTKKPDRDYMDDRDNKAITDEVDELKALGKDAIVDELKRYGFNEANLGNDAAWLASKLRSLRHGELTEHEMTPEGYKLMLKDFT